MGRQLAEDMQVAIADANDRIGSEQCIDALAAAMAAYAKFVAQRRVGFDFIFSRELVEQQCEDLIHASRSVMDILRVIHAVR